LLEAGERLEQNALAGVAAHPALVPVLAELGPEHFDGEQHRRLREQLVSGSEPDEELVGLVAELDARATSEGIDERTAEQLLLGLRARRIKRELSDADPGPYHGVAGLTGQNSGYGRGIGRRAGVLALRLRS